MIPSSWICMATQLLSLLTCGLLADKRELLPIGVFWVLPTWQCFVKRMDLESKSVEWAKLYFYLGIRFTGSTLWRLLVNGKSQNTLETATTKPIDLKLICMDVGDDWTQRWPNLVVNTRADSGDPILHVPNASTQAHVQKQKSLHLNFVLALV